MFGAPPGGWIPFLYRYLQAVLRTGRKELRMVLLLLFVSAAAWGFTAVADEVTEGDTRELDTAILLAMRNRSDPAEPWGPHWFEEIARDITALGGVAILTGLTLAAAGYLWFRGKLLTMIFLLASVGSGTLASNLLKQGFDRPRPDLVPHGSHVYTASFPSGHSMMSAVVYLTIGALLAKVERQRSIQAYVLFLAAFLSFAVGLSRIYLGVHWPSDVVAGWLGGAAWAAAWWTLEDILQRTRPRPEPAAGGDPPPRAS